MTAYSQDTMSEGLRKVLGQIAGLKVTPDADDEFLTAIESMIVGKLKQVAGMAAGVSPQGGGGGMGGGMGGGGGMASQPADLSGMGQPNQMSPGGMAGGGMGGLTTPPNPDELRRILEGSGVPG